MRKCITKSDASFNTWIANTDENEGVLGRKIEREEVKRVEFLHSLASLLLIQI